MEQTATNVGRLPRKIVRGRMRPHLMANFLIVALFLYAALSVEWGKLPTFTPSSFVMAEGMSLADRNGSELYKYYTPNDRIDLPLEVFPQHLRDAVVAIEDERFFSRSCIDARALLRAGVANIFDFKSQGASTITQQLLRNAFGLRDKTFARKTLELSLACKLETSMDKDTILELYLNHASFGGATFGAQQASRAYLGVDVGDLTLAQSAVLAALLQRPTYFSPYGSQRRTLVDGETIRAIRRGDIDRAEDVSADAVTIGLVGVQYATGDGDVIVIPGRADDVLASMRRRRMIDNEAYRSAKQELRRTRFHPLHYPVSTPYYPRLVREELAAIPAVGERCRFVTSGCKITASLDAELQLLAERIVRERADEIRATFGADNVALVAADRASRQIVAYVGNVGFSESGSGAKIDMARVPRQPGSSFKPFVYATAFERGYDPGTLLFDGPISIGGVRPRNYGGGYGGWMSIRHALAASRNIPAILTYFFVGGEDPVLHMAWRLGAQYPLEHRSEMRAKNPWYSYGYPLAIGAAEVPLLQMVEGYATLANEGRYAPLTSIVDVRKADGTVVYATEGEVEARQATSPLVAREITAILSDNTFRPTPLWKELLTLDGVDAAAKTGTSNQCAAVDPRTGACTALLPTDVWTIGYTPWLVVGVWVGNATHAPLAQNADGLNVASPIWKKFLQEAHAAHPTESVRFTNLPVLKNRQSARR